MNNLNMNGIYIMFSKRRYISPKYVWVVIKACIYRFQPKNAARIVDTKYRQLSIVWGD
jgi:hypothetical protein